MMGQKSKQHGERKTWRGHCPREPRTQAKMKHAYKSNPKHSTKGAIAE